MTHLKDWNDEERIAHVKKFFSGITSKYDFMNHFMSAGQDILWRKFTAKRIPENPGNLLDIACGTGDLSFEMAKRYPSAQIKGLDFVKEMIDRSNEKKEIKQSKNVNFIVGDALNLPFADESFDACTIAFGFRNIPDKDKAISEMKRVLQPGGKILILEMTLPKTAFMRPFYAFYLKYVIPFMGKFFSPDPDAYNYLSDSIKDFYQPEELVKLFTKHELKHIKAHPLSLGITYLHEGQKNVE